jgi:hypothetical protein
VVDLIHLDDVRLDDVVTDELEMVVTEEVLDISARSGKEVVEAGDFVAVSQQTFAKVRAQEAGAAGHQDAFHSGWVAGVTRLDKRCLKSASGEAPRAEAGRACMALRRSRCVILGAGKSPRHAEVGRPQARISVGLRERDEVIWSALRRATIVLRPMP